MPAERSPRPKLISLERRFVAVSEPLASGEISPELLRWAAKTLQWDDVLTKRCAVVFGEAGTGKTAEFRGRASALVAAGCAAFFLPVEAVAQRGIAPSLDLKGSEAFGRWREDATAEAWFLLDSVDESKLKGQALATALNALARELGETSLRRSHIILSSRASDWRSSDEDALNELARYLFASESGEAQEPLLLQLLPLDEAQIRALATHHGLSDLDAFLGAVRGSNAWSFLQRPLDVKWLARYWLTNGRLGSHRELISHNIDERLSEREDRPSLLARDEARRIAGKLALAALLTRSAAFLLPGETDPNATGALDPGELLPECSAGAIRDLLARGLFDEATYGRVRIHHRSVTDFLAAEQLERMRAGGLSQTDLEALLFRSVAERTVVPTHLTALAAWLAPDNPAIRRSIIAHSPETLIDEADPSSLSATDRRATLRAYAERFADREQVFHYFDPFGLQRFATPELTETIRELLSNANESEHLRITLLRMVAGGRIEALMDDALTCALAMKTTPALRLAAIRAVAEGGSDAHRARLASLVRTPAAKDPEMLATLLKVLFPTHLSGTQVAEALLIVLRPSRTVTSLDVLASELAQTCDRPQRAALLAALVAALRPPDANAKDALRPEHLWLSEYIAETAARVVDDGAPFPPALAGAMKLLRDARDLPGHVSTDRVNRLLDAHPHLRRDDFWAVVAERAMRGTYPRSAFELLPNRLSSADHDWLRADCINRTNVRERLVAFDCLPRVLPGPLSPVAKVELLQAVASESQAKNGDDALAIRLHRMLNPRWIEPHPLARMMDRQQRLRDGKQKRLHDENSVALKAALSSIRSGAHVRALQHLYETCSSRDTNARHDALSVDKIRALYGADVAQAAVEGFREYWRHANLPRLEEGAPNSIPFSIILGLVGVTLDVAGGVDVGALPEDLVSRVVTLASRELNGFPSWFASVATRRTDIVRNVFGPPLRLDYDAAPGPKKPSFGLLLWKLQTAPMEVHRACAPLLREWILERDPANPEVLDAVLDLLAATQSMSANELQALALARLGGCDDDAMRFSIWWCAWLACKADAAISFLSGAVPQSKRPRQLMEEVCARAWTKHDMRSRTSKSPLRGDRDALVALIPLVHSHVQDRDDVKHEGVYSPERRDHAQDLRDSLIGYLAEIPGEASVRALDRLASDELFAKQRDWLLHLADAHAAMDAAAMAMSPSDAVKFLRSEVLQPKRTADLFLIGQNRLEEIRDNIAHGDFSVRAIYSPKNSSVLEEDVQNYLSQELDHRRRDQYTVVREPEVTRRKRPDIRLVHPACEGPVTLELKIAERWSISELEAALRSQLVGTYMRANSSRFGALVVCSSGPTRIWELGSRRVAFEEVVERLRAQARAIALADADVEGLAIVAIDFH